MIHCYFCDPAGVTHAIKLIGRPIAARTRPGINRIEACFWNLWRVSRMCGLCFRRSSLTIGHVARLPEIHLRVLRVGPVALELHGRIIVVENDLVCLMSNRSQRYDGRAGTEQVIGKDRHLIDIAEIFDHSIAGAALKRPRTVFLVRCRDAMPAMDEDNLPTQPAMGLCADW